MRTAALVVLALTLTAAASAAPAGGPPGEDPPAPEPVRWRNSLALGSPAAGRLVRGVRLPPRGAHFFSWDPVLRRSPNRQWRRWGTDDLVRIVLRVVRDYAAAHPRAPRLGIGDLSRPRGGYFGPKHASHQNGLDVDVYYPRLDGRERPPRRGDQIHHRLAQELVDRFVRAGAEIVYVGPNTALSGPRRVVRVLWNHDNHMHVRIALPLVESDAGPRPRKPSRGAAAALRAAPAVRVLTDGYDSLPLMRARGYTTVHAVLLKTPAVAWSPDER